MTSVSKATGTNRHAVGWFVEGISLAFILIDL